MKNKKLWIVVLTIELANALLSYVIGRSQVNKCPRDTTLPLISVLLSIFALATLLAFAVQSFKSRSWLVFIVTVLGCLFIIGAGFMLWFIAYGGLDWCNYHF